MILVSACLLGVACNHEGRAASRSVREELESRYRIVPVCPEVLGGLTTPRPAAEIQPDGRVVNVEGTDVTAAYRRGAEAAVRVAGAAGAPRAVLKARSPSCGSAQVYDGTFTGTLEEGEGVTAAALRAAGVEVTSEDDPLP
ncbi:MAG: DUF523 domain-containing protein [Actinobacteria bacterium]|nr:DUF523 domain-containing protein [Actinomycetota bacterium]